jgi:molybdenum cofactor biosynthesis protein B
VPHQPHETAAPERLTVALLTVSDSRGAGNDPSGDLMQRLVEAAGHRTGARGWVRDEPDEVEAWIRQRLAAKDCDAVVTSGGTGLSTRDRTYEAVVGLLERRLDGFGEIFRALSYRQIGSAAMLSRAVAGIASGTPVFCLPGSPAAVELALRELVLPELRHLVSELRKRG